MRNCFRWALVPVLLAAGGCGGEDPAELALAEVGSQVISLGEFQRAFDEFKAHEDLGRIADRAAAEGFLQTYIDKTLTEQLAADSIPWTPRLEHRATSFLETLMVRRMRDEEYGFAARLTDEDFAEAYEKARYIYHYQAIPFATRQDALAKLLTIREGAQFAMVANHVLGNTSGGNRGWGSILDTPEAIILELEKLSPSEVGGPLEAGGQYYLVRLVEERDENPGRPSPEELRQGLELRLIQERGGRLVRRFQTGLLEKYRFEPRMAEVLWMTEFLREETRSMSRQYTPNLTGEEIGGMQVSRAGAADAPPWTENPFNEEESARLLAVTAVDSIPALLYLDHLLTKPTFSWPVFDRPEVTMSLLRELVIDRLERVEAWERDLDQNPELCWQAEKRRKLIHTRQFFLRKIRARARPTVEEARRWFDERQAQLDRPESRRYVMVIVSDWEAALAAREVLAGGGAAATAFSRIQAEVDPGATWLGPRGTTIVEGRVSSPLDRQILELSLGDATQPVPLGDRIAIARLEEIIRPEIPHFEDVADDVIEQIEAQRGDSLFAAELAARRAITPITIYSQVLDLVRLGRAEGSGP